MNIIVFVKPVPDPEYYQKITIDPVTKRLNRDGIPNVINPADKNALEFALSLRASSDDKIIVISMAPQFGLPLMEKCLAIGADEAYLVSDSAFGGSDTFSTSYILSKSLVKLGISADLILCGNESADGSTSHVPSQLGEWLGVSHISNISVIKIENCSAEVSKKIENGSISYRVKLPALFSISRDSNVPRLISAYDIVKVRNKKLEVMNQLDLNLDERMIGLSGSPTQPGEIMVMEMKRNAIEIAGSESQIAKELYDIIKKSGIVYKGGESQ